MLRNRRTNGSGSPRYTGSPTSSPSGSPRIIVTRSIGGSPRSHEVGEIDTRSPFQSVRAAVSLFGETDSSPKAKPITFKKSKTAEEKVQEKESQLNLALRELDSFKQQIRSTETTKGHALRELENAKLTLQELTSQLETLCESKQAAIQATEAAKARAKQLEDDISNNLSAGVATNSKHNCDSELLIIADKEASILQSLRKAKEEAEKKIRNLKEDSHHQLLNQNLVDKLEETNKAIEVLQEQLNNVCASDLDAFTEASSELDCTTKAFQEIVAEKRSLRGLVDSLQVELDNLKGLNSQLKMKAEEAETLAENLRMDLDNSKKELEANMPKGDASDVSRTQQFTSKAVQFLREAEDMKKNAELLRQEAVTAAEGLASDQIHNSSTTAEDASDMTSSESNGKIKLAVEKYKALSQKMEETRSEADIKVTAAMAQVEMITANEKEVRMKVDAGLKEKYDIEVAIKEALKVAEMAEAAKKVVESQLKKKPSKAPRSRSWRIF